MVEVYFPSSNNIGSPTGLVCQRNCYIYDYGKALNVISDFLLFSINAYWAKAKHVGQSALHKESHLKVPSQFYRLGFANLPIWFRGSVEQRKLHRGEKEDKWICEQSWLHIHEMVLACLTKITQWYAISCHLNFGPRLLTPSPLWRHHSIQRIQKITWHIYDVIMMSTMYVLIGSQKLADFFFFSYYY